MATFTTDVQTPAGDVVVMTKSRVLGILKRPSTSVIPRHGLGVQFRWVTDDPDKLEYLHRLIVSFMNNVTYPELRAFLNLYINFNNEVQRIGKQLEMALPSAPLPDELQGIWPYLKAIV
ncbi:MAG: hypothetical protein CXZ00_11320 [Acidobacteria bacterium]|nr:MAG: hypothetical protein CXZ00_11320 [Acidobacteriota bacterium]